MTGSRPRFLLVALAVAFAPVGSQALAQSDPLPSYAEVGARYADEDYEGALELSAQRLAAARSGRLPAHELCQILSAHGAILNELGRTGEAIAALRESVESCDNTPGVALATALTASYNLAMVELGAGEAEAAARRFEALFHRRLAALGENGFGFQVYDDDAVKALIGMIDASTEAGDSDKAAAVVLERFQAINVALDDNALRADFLESAFDMFEARGELGRFIEHSAYEFSPDHSELESFVSASEPIGGYEGYDLYRQYDVLRATLEAVGKADKAREIAFKDPDWIELNFYDLLDAGDAAGAKALLFEARARTSACSFSCRPLALRVLEFSQQDAWDLLTGDEKIALIEDVIKLATYSEGEFGEAGREGYGELAALYESLGRKAEAQAARIHASVVAPDPDLGDDLRLTYARRLREAGLVDQADRIVADAMECGFGPLIEGEPPRNQPCDSAMLAMREHAAQLERKGRKQDAEFFRLPAAIVEAYEDFDDEAAHRDSERLLALGQRLFAPDHKYSMMAIAIYDAVHTWQDVPLFDIPRAYRLCGRWDEPEPPRVADPNALPMPMVMSSGPATRSFSFGLPSYSALDPRGVFRHSMTNRAGNSFDRYVGQCVFAGRLDDGLKVADWAIGEAERMGYPIREREGLLLVKAQALKLAGDFDAAEATYLSMVDTYLSGRENPGNPFDPYQALTALITLYSELGRIERLEVLVTRMIESGEFREEQVRPLMETLFEFSVAKGDIEKASRLLANLAPYDDPGLAAARQSGGDVAYAERQAESSFANRLAMLQLANGERGAALATLEEAIEANNVLLAAPSAEIGGNPGDPDGEFFRDFLLNGQLYAHLSRLKAEDEDYAGALELLERSGMVRFAERIIEFAERDGIDLSQLSLSSSDTGMAMLIPAYRGALAAGAELALRTGDLERALRYMTMARRLPRPPTAHIMESQIAWTSVALGVLDPAQRELARQDAALMAADLEQQWKLATRSPLDASYVQYALTSAPAYFADIAALGWADRQDGLGPDDATIFGYVQRAILSKTDLSIANSIGRALLAKSRPELLALLDERDLVTTGLFKSSQINIGYGSLTVGENSEYGEPTDRAFSTSAARVREIDERLAREAPDYLELTSSEPLPLAEAQALLKPEEAVLLLAPGRFGTQAILLTAEGMKWRQSDLKLEELETAVRRLRFFAGAEVELSASESRTWLGEVDGGINGFDRATAHRLYAELVAPFLPELGGRTHLYIAGGGPLTSLPFALLVSEIAPGADDDPAALRATRWLGDDFALVQIPSLQSFALLRRNPGLAANGEPSFIGFGDPALEGDPIPRGARRSGGGGAGVATLWGRRDGHEAVDLQKIREMPRLDGTAEELEEIAAALGAPASSLRLREQATEANLKSAALAEADVLAIATHGITAGEIPGAGEPGLILTPPDAASALDDGYLSASEVAQLTLHADWVILSACNTAAGDGEPGSPALSGLAKAFFHAGARGLLVSHWPVRDDASAKLTVAAIERRKAHPELSRAEALQWAMRQIRDNPSADGFATDAFGAEVQQSWAHPSAWAPFTLVGDAR